MILFIISFVISMVITIYSIGYMIDHGAKTVYYGIKHEQSYFWNINKYVAWITIAWTITLITLLSNLNLI